MIRKVLLIGENNASFITNALQEALKNEGYDVAFVPPVVDEISKYEEERDIFLIYADEKMKDAMDAIIYVRDICLERDKRIYLIGYNEEVDMIRKVVSDQLVAAVFERPINTKLLVERLNQDVKLAEKEEMKKHILVVDDSGMMLRTIKSWLTPKYRVSMASSGAMAISFLATNKPDLILLDYEMPICSGPQFMEMIRAEVSTASIPVIFLTSKGDRESVKKVLALKPAGYLLKTMEMNEILKTINQFFEKADNERRNKLI